MRLFLVRHGQTTANFEKCYSGQADVPLTELGRQQAAAIRPILERFSFDRVYSSDLSRAIDTQMLALPGYTGQRLALLREIDVGNLTGKSIPETRAQLGELSKKLPIEGYAQFGGESTQQFAERASRFLKLLEEDPCDNVIAFAHNGYLNAVLQTVLGGQIDRSKVASGNCAIHVFKFDGTKWTLRAWNYMGEI